jgi:hypothetical protein
MSRLLIVPERWCDAITVKVLRATAFDSVVGDDLGALNHHPLEGSTTQGYCAVAQDRAPKTPSCDLCTYGCRSGMVIPVKEEVAG